MIWATLLRALPSLREISSTSCARRRSRTAARLTIQVQGFVKAACTAISWRPLRRHPSPRLRRRSRRVRPAGGCRCRRPHHHRPRVDRRARSRCSPSRSSTTSRSGRQNCETASVPSHRPVPRSRRRARRTPRIRYEVSLTTHLDHRATLPFRTNGDGTFASFTVGALRGRRLALGRGATSAPLPCRRRRRFESLFGARNPTPVAWRSACTSFAVNATLFLLFDLG